MAKEPKEQEPKKERKKNTKKRQFRKKVEDNIQEKSQLSSRGKSVLAKYEISNEKKDIKMKELGSSKDRRKYNKKKYKKKETEDNTKEKFAPVIESRRENKGDRTIRTQQNRIEKEQESRKSKLYTKKKYVRKKNEASTENDTNISKEERGSNRGDNVNDRGGRAGRRGRGRRVGRTGNTGSSGRRGRIGRRGRTGRRGRRGSGQKGVHHPRAD
mmetsp:Transcript_19567/g.29195  ORF Transcript_19567/g.29195 Transcript_19567/m.29195 type:complete len:214 (+) Transcript_19567:237-878(+)